MSPLAARAGFRDGKDADECFAAALGHRTAARNGTRSLRQENSKFVTTQSSQNVCAAE